MKKKQVKVFPFLTTFFLFLTFCLILNLPLFAKKKHPKLEAEIITEDPLVCAKCHMNQVQAWEKSLHGIYQVRCVICHGDLEKRFERVAKPSNCVMCHGKSVEDLEKAKGFQTCFDCHKGHTLEIKPGSKNIHK